MIISKRKWKRFNPKNDRRSPIYSRMSREEGHTSLNGRSKRKCFSLNVTRISKTISTTKKSYNNFLKTETDITKRRAKRRLKSALTKATGNLNIPLFEKTGNSVFTSELSRKLERKVKSLKAFSKYEKTMDEVNSLLGDDKKIEFKPNDEAIKKNKEKRTDRNKPIFYKDRTQVVKKI